MPKKVKRIAELAEGLGLDKESLAEVRGKISERSRSGLLAALRVHAGLTQKELAARMGRTQSAVSKLETAKNDDFRLGDVREYASVLGLNVTIDLSAPRTLAQEIRLQQERFVMLIDRLRECERDDSSISAALDKFKNDMSARILDLFLKMTPAASGTPAEERIPRLSAGTLEERERTAEASCPIR